MVSQPSLSNMIARLEKEFEVKLFERKGRNIKLTEHGKILHHYSILVTNLIFELEKELQDHSDRMQNSITLGSLNSIFVNDWLSEFLAFHPESSVTHVPLNEQVLLERLHIGSLDFALTVKQPSGKEFQHCFLAKDKFVLLVPKSHPLSSKKAIYFKEASNERFLALESPETFSRIIDIISTLAGFKPHIVFEGETSLLERLCAAGNGCFLHMKSTAHEIDMRRIHEIDLLDHFANIDLYLCWKKDKPMSRSCEIFRDFIVNWYKKFN